MGRCQESLKGRIICFFYLWELLTVECEELCSVGLSKTGKLHVFLSLVNVNNAFKSLKVGRCVCAAGQELRAQVGATFPHLGHGSASQLPPGWALCCPCASHTSLTCRKRFPLPWDYFPCLAETLFSFSSWTGIVLLWFLLNFWAFTE